MICPLSFHCGFTRSVIAASPASRPRSLSSASFRKTSSCCAFGMTTARTLPAALRSTPPGSLSSSTLVAVMSPPFASTLRITAAAVSIAALYTASALAS